MALIDALGIKTLHAVIGGSLGGMLALNSAVRYPERVRNVISIAAGMELTTLQRIHNFEQIFAIEEDAAFNNGDYYETGHPDKGLALARMISHKTFVSLSTMARRARRELVQQDEDLRQYEITHPVESYLLHQGKKFVARFDANTYLRIMGAWQHYDLARDSGLTNRCPFEVCKDQRHLVFSIDSDVCFYPDEQLAIAHTLRKCGIPHQHITVHSGKGHDAFLLEPKLFTPHLVYTLRNKW
jgi:homoserine O-acetyltransferase